MSSKPEVKDIVDNIILTAGDIESTKRKLKTLKEQVAEILEGMDEAEAVELAADALAVAKQKLASALMGRREYNDLMENIAEYSHKLKGEKDVLSLHLVAYYKLADDGTQIEVDEMGNAREVILTGKLGAEQKYQTSMFAKE